MGADGLTRYDGKTLAELPFQKSFPITVSGLEDAELPTVLMEYRYAVKVLLDEQVRRKMKKHRKEKTK